MYFLRNLRKIRTYYFVQLLTLPAKNLHVTLGDTIKEEQRKKVFLARFRSGPIEYLFEWPTRLDIVGELKNLLSEQVWPPIDSTLTPNEVLSCIEERISGSNNEIVLWSEAMLTAMCGDLEAARRKFQTLDEERSKRMSALSDKPHLVTEIDIENKKELERVLQVIADKERFDDYCQKTAGNTIKSLKIPKKYL